jgi:predicted dehydrogenase
MKEGSVESIKWGIIGCGDVAEHKSGPPLYQTPGSELVAVMRRDKEKAADFARRHKAKRWYTDVEALLADSEINAVYVASPHHLHMTHASQAAQAGKIVLCEKPMGTSQAEAQAIVDACHGQRVPLAVAYYRRFWPVTGKVKDLLEEGAVGAVMQASVQISDYFQGDPTRAWLTSQAMAGGGALANAGSHWLDLIRYLFGEIQDVSAYSSCAAGGFEVEDTAAVLMRTVSGTFVSFLSSWQSQVAVNELAILGTHGRILVGSLAAGRLQLFRHDKEPESFDLGRSGPAHGELVADLVSGLIAGQAPRVPGQEAVAVWRIIEAAYESSRTGCRAPVS